MQLDDHVEPRHDRPVFGVLIVTPIKLYRDGIAHFLRSSSHFEVLETAGESETTLALASELRPDVVLLDMALDRSRETARALRQLLPEAQIMGLAVPEAEGFVVDCFEAGICGYVPRDGSLEELLDTLMLAVEGKAQCSARVTAALIRRLAARACQDDERAPAARAPIPLTAREAEVVSLLEDGLSNKQIARRLFIEVPTVKNHVHSILEKLGARSRGEAAARARRLQLH
jgi:two-component system nitrate/nitrite response regulator NarL